MHNLIKWLCLLLHAPEPSLNYEVLLHMCSQEQTACLMSVSSSHVSSLVLDLALFLAEIQVVKPAPLDVSV